MQRFAHWTNLSETTFVLAADRAEAPTIASASSPRSRELPFAGHPTLGTCHAWLGGRRRPRATPSSRSAPPAWCRCAAPRPASRSPPRRSALRAGRRRSSSSARASLGIARDEIVDAQWVDNGPGWVAVLLASADAVLALRPGAVDLDVGVVGPYPPARRGVRGARVLPEGRRDGRGPGHRQPERVARRVAAGHAAARARRTSRARARRSAAPAASTSSRDGDGTIWVGGGTVTCVSGRVEL